MSEVLAGLTSPPPQIEPRNMIMKAIHPPSLAIMSPTECFSPSYHTNFPDDSRRYIDEEIARMEESIRALKSRRNTLAPITKLPPELLAKTFVICAQSFFDDENPPQRLKGWIRITHVSRYWRTVALNCPNLWAYPIFHSLHWCREMLRRSKMAPLVIHASLGGIFTPLMTEAIKLALKQMSRTKELTIVASVPTMEKLFAELPTSAPILKSLSLSGPRELPLYGDYTFEIPEDFLSHDTPSLRRVELQECDVKWTSPFLSGLTYMKIHSTSLQARPTTAQLLDVLERMPQLEVLDLAECLPAMGATISSAFLDRVVILPRLTDLNLGGSVPECANFLKHVSFPTSVRTSLRCRGTEGTGVDFSSILSIFSQASASDSVETKQPLLVAAFLVTSRLVRFFGYKTMVPLKQCGPAQGPKPDIELDFSWVGSDASTPQHAMLNLCKALPLSGIKTSRVMANCEKFDTNAWGMMLGHITSLTKLHVTGSSALALVPALVLDCPNASTGGSPFQSPVCFPNLRHLIIEDVEFGEDRELTSENWEQLLDVMMERYELDAEIRKITLSCCTHVLSEDVDRLREIVVDAEWDEVEMGFSDFEDFTEFDYGDDHIYSSAMSDMLVDDVFGGFGW